MTRTTQEARTAVSIRLGGAAGDGVASTGEIFGKAPSRSGKHVYAYNSYQSVIRGGHVWFQIRGSDDPVLCVGQHADILIALSTHTGRPTTPGAGVSLSPPTRASCLSGAASGRRSKGMRRDLGPPRTKHFIGASLSAAIRSL